MRRISAGRRQLERAADRIAIDWRIEDQLDLLAGRQRLAFAGEAAGQGRLRRGGEAPALGREQRQVAAGRHSAGAQRDGIAGGGPPAGEWREQRQLPAIGQILEHQIAIGAGVISRLARSELRSSGCESVIASVARGATAAAPSAGATSSTAGAGVLKLHENGRLSWTPAISLSAASIVAR